MRQKYIISRERATNDLVIKEYAAIGEEPRQMYNATPFEEDFTFVCQENYKGDRIQGAISSGIDELITVLRTRNLYPNGRLASRLAESVKELYSSEDRSTDVIFDDVELLA